MTATKPDRAWRGSARWGIALGLVAAALLAGCAAPTSFSPQVMAHSRWDAQRQVGIFSFERLPSQDADPIAQGQLEAAALPALLKLGFSLSETPGGGVYAVQLNARVRIDRDPMYRYDPFWPSVWGSYGGPGRVGLGFYFGNGPVGPFSPYGPYGPMWMAPPTPPVARMQVDVLIRDRQSGSVVYEAHARHDRVGQADNRLWPFLYQAALSRFPATLTEPVEVEVSLLPPAPR